MSLTKQYIEKHKEAFIAECEHVQEMLTKIGKAMDAKDDELYTKLNNEYMATWTVDCEHGSTKIECDVCNEIWMEM